jgi:hypothetical protein
LPADEAQRRRARFEQVCENQKALPGSGVTDASLEACAAALDRSPCELPNGDPAVCNFHGSLPGGASCNEGLQCESGRCSGTEIFLPGFGQSGPIICGTCEPPASTGEVCGYDAGCVGDGVCIIDPHTADAGMSTYTCVSPAEGTLGDDCDDLYKVCEVGLYCSALTGHCERLARTGEACGEVTGYPGGCAPALSCVDGKCALGSEGDFCQGDLDCAPGLGCGSLSLQPSKCEAVTWADAGEPCDGYRTRCRLGSCDRGGPVPGTYTCPTVLADGAPCTAVGCDTFAICFRPTRADAGTAQSGTCTLLDSTVCN